jgi:hypothetical protein
MGLKAPAVPASVHPKAIWMVWILNMLKERPRCLWEMMVLEPLTGGLCFMIHIS